jgi:signal transduction histidine kinase
MSRVNSAANESASPSADAAPPFLARALHWRRLRLMLFAVALPILIQSINWETAYWILYARWLFLGVVLLLVFCWFERWPKRLPRWLARWALQVAMVALVIPFTVAIAYALTTIGLDPPWYKDPSRLQGYGFMTLFSLLIAPWMTLSALLRFVTGAAEKQALAFQLERSQMTEQAMAARLSLLQAQVEPHFLFNTLANIRELVDSRSPQASKVLDSLITYLRAAVPSLDQRDTSVIAEIKQVEAYLDVMQMRMPDRLTLRIDIDPRLAECRCLPASILTLVENAIRHGIDPSEEGGEVAVIALRAIDQAVVQVQDTGVGLPLAWVEGTGLGNLRERLRIAYGNQASLSLSAMSPHGSQAVLVFPLRLKEQDL